MLLDLSISQQEELPRSFLWRHIACHFRMYCNSLTCLRWWTLRLFPVFFFHALGFKGSSHVLILHVGKCSSSKFPLLHKNHHGKKFFNGNISPPWTVMAVTKRDLFLLQFPWEWNGCSYLASSEKCCRTSKWNGKTWFSSWRLEFE